MHMPILFFVFLLVCLATASVLHEPARERIRRVAKLAADLSGLRTLAKLVLSLGQLRPAVVGSLAVVLTWASFLLSPGNALADTAPAAPSTGAAVGGAALTFLLGTVVPALLALALIPAIGLVFAGIYFGLKWVRAQDVRIKNEAGRKAYDAFFDTLTQIATRIENREKVVAKADLDAGKKDAVTIGKDLMSAALDEADKAVKEEAWQDVCAHMGWDPNNWTGNVSNLIEFILHGGTNVNTNNGALVQMGGEKSSLVTTAAAKDATARANADA